MSDTRTCYLNKMVYLFYFFDKYILNSIFEFLFSIIEKSPRISATRFETWWIMSLPLYFPLKCQAFVGSKVRACDVHLSHTSHYALSPLDQSIGGHPSLIFTKKIQKKYLNMTSLNFPVTLLKVANFMIFIHLSLRKA